MDQEIDEGKGAPPLSTVQFSLLESGKDVAMADRQNGETGLKRAYFSGSIRPGKKPGTFECRYRGRSKTVEATGTKQAQSKLREWIAEVEQETERSSGNSMEQLFDLMLVDLAENNRKDIGSVKRRWKNHLRPAFGHIDGGAITQTDIQKYKSRRLKAGAANATINREIAIVRRVLNLAHEHELIKSPLHLRTLTERNVRSGFVGTDDYRRILDALPEHVKPLWVIGFYCGVRKGELLSFRWEWVDWTDRKIRIPGDVTKNEKGHEIPIDMGEIEAYLRIAWATRNPKCPFLFQYRGRRLKSFRTAFEKTRAKLGLDSTLFHDLRRSSVMTLEKSGVPRSDAMRITNHSTESVYRRYAIGDDRATSEAARRVNEYLNREQAKKSLPENCGINCGTAVLGPDDSIN